MMCHERSQIEIVRIFKIRTISSYAIDIVEYDHIPLNMTIEIAVREL
mgnify:CR=1 FL=1